MPHIQLSLGSLKQQLSIISFSIGQKPKSGLAWCSAQSLIRLKSGYQVRCVSFWNLRSSCKLMWLLEEFISLGWKSPFLARCQQRATLNNWRLPAPPYHVALSTLWPLLSFVARKNVSHWLPIPCLQLKKTCLYRAYLIKSGHPGESTISHILQHNHGMIS